MRLTPAPKFHFQVMINRQRKDGRPSIVCKSKYLALRLLSGNNRPNGRPDLFWLRSLVQQFAYRPYLNGSSDVAAAVEVAPGCLRDSSNCPVAKSDTRSDN